MLTILHILFPLPYIYIFIIRYDEPFLFSSEGFIKSRKTVGGKVFTSYKWEGIAQESVEGNRITFI